MIRQKWHYNGTLLNTKAWSVTSVPEGIGTPGLRGENIQVPFQNGKHWIKKRYDERIVMLPMWVRGLDPITGKLPSAISGNEMLYQNIDFLSSVLGVRGQHSLVRSFPSGEEREAKAEVYRSVIFDKAKDGYAKFVVEFQLLDPFFYSMQLVSETKDITSATYEWGHLNPGTAPVNKAEITLSGPMEYPKIECVASGIWLSYMGTIAAGEAVVINTGEFLCSKDGANMISSVRHGGDAYWMNLEAGSNQLRLMNDVVGGQVKIEYKPAYF